MALFAAYLTVQRVATREGISNQFLMLLFVEHATATAFYMTALEGDWIRYFRDGKLFADQGLGFDYFYPGTRFIVAISHFLQTIGPFSIPSLFVLFSLCGYVGLVFFVAACRPLITLPNDWYWQGIFLLPGLHIWTCALGKDSLIFLPVCFILYGISRNKLDVISFAGATSLIFLIRPHIAMFMIASAFTASALTNVSNSFSQKIGKVLITGIAIGLLLPTVQSFTGVQEATFEAASDRIEYAASKNQTGGGAVDITKYSPPIRLASYLFRPLFFDAKNTLGLLASIENLILLGLCSTLIRKDIFAFLLIRPRFSTVFAVCFVAIMWAVLGMSTANLGLALRQKTQFLPYLLFLILLFRFWRSSKTVAIPNRVDLTVNLEF